MGDLVCAIDRASTQLSAISGLGQSCLQTNVLHPDRMLSVVQYV